jgi:hypothetical protein
LPTRASLHNYTQSKDELKDPISAVVVQTRDADGNVLMDEVVDRDRVQEATEKQQAMLGAGTTTLTLSAQQSQHYSEERIKEEQVFTVDH